MNIADPAQNTPNRICIIRNAIRSSTGIDMSLRPYSYEPGAR